MMLALPRLRPALLPAWLALFTIPGVALSADVMKPSEVAGLLAGRIGDDVHLSWSAVTTDAAGGPETVDHYNVYRGTTPDFVPDTVGGGNRIGGPISTQFDDLGAAGAPSDFYYLVTAVDAAGNESPTKPSKVTTPPVLTGSWTDTTVELSWSGATPSTEVGKYLVYYGTASNRYDAVKDVGLATSTSMTGLTTNVFYYFSVVAVDTAGNAGGFSNEHVEARGGRGRVRAHDDAYLCWGAGNCPPDDPEEIQRSDGWQILHPVDFPPGDWTRVRVTYTIDSRLCQNGQQGTTDKCGGSNPGGYNPCGDPWDRIAHLFLVLDDCVETGAGCINPGNPELMRAITPFGTDAPPPAGSGVVPPRVLTLDVTPYAPLLVGRRYVGAEIVHFVQAGWHVTVDFELSERADEASPKKPSAGIVPVVFEGGGPILTPRTITIPPEAEQVFGRFFITGHGGNLACDGGSNNGGACTDSSQCPGGSCQNCDEFCHRQHLIKVDGQTAWNVTPWRDDCSPGGLTDCTNWNACGWPSCTFSRAGWCPGYIACHQSGPCDQDIDLTLWLTPGATHDLTWEIPVRNGDWSKSLVVYWYEESIAVCGNGVREGAEQCDASDLGGQSCQTQGFDSGTLACNATCDGFNTSGCRFYQCGNDVCEPGGGEDCLSCPQDCNGVQGGSPGNRYCCGDGAGQNPVPCSDPRCTAGGNGCE